MRAPSPGGFQGDVQSPRLDVIGRYTEQASHFARMGSQGQHRRLALIEMVGHAGVSVKSIRVQDNWELRFGDDPICRTTITPQLEARGETSWPSFGAVKVTVKSAVTTGPPRSSASEAIPEGMSTEITMPLGHLPPVVVVFWVMFWASFWAQF